MERAFLLLGSNEGDRAACLSKARKALEEIGKPFVASSVYQTAAWGNTDQAPFLNQVVGISTSLTARELLKQVLSIEDSLGRKRTGRWSSRTIDIDILFYGGEIIREPDLTVPHPAIAQRRFVLVPMAEAAPDLVHPVLKKNMRVLLEACEDDLGVEVFP